MSDEDETLRRALSTEVYQNGRVIPKESVDAALRRLARPIQVVLRMRYMRGLTEHQIGMILSMSQREVSAQIKDGVEQLREILK